MDIGTKGHRTLAVATTAVALLCVPGAAPAGTPAVDGLAEVAPAPRLVVPAQLPPVPQLPPTPSLPPTPQLPTAPQLPSPPSPPPVQAPTLPGVPGPPSAPSAPGGLERSGGSGGSGGGASGGSGGSAPSQGGSDVNGGSGARGDTGTGRRGSRTRAQRRRIAERRLRRSVRENRGCLSSLTGFQEQVLEMRAGGDGQPARSRHGVARRLGVPADSVARAEARGLVSLRRIADSGSCGMAITPGSFGSVPPLLPLALVSPMPELTKLASLSSSPDARADVAGAVLGDTASSEEGVSESDLGAAGEVAAAPVAADADGDPPALPVLLSALLVLAGVGAYFLLLRPRREAGVTTTGRPWLETGAPWLGAGTAGTASRTEPETPPQAEPEAPPQAEPEAPPQAEPETPPQAEPETPPQAEPEAPPQAEPEAPAPFAAGAATHAPPARERLKVPEAPWHRESAHETAPASVPEPDAHETHSPPAPAGTSPGPPQAKSRIASAAGTAASAISSVAARAFEQRRGRSGRGR